MIKAVAQMYRLILASQSPRRRELLTQMGVIFEVIPSAFDEQLDDARSPEEVAIELAFGKAEEIARRYPEAVVIGSDTIVAVNGRQLGKPESQDDALRMLRALSGTYNEVTTSAVIVHQARNVRLAGADTTRVYFKPFDETAVNAYLASDDYKDKAGAYGIQSGAAPLIDHIAGRYDTVVGLPTHVLAELLQQVGIPAAAADLQSPVKQKPGIVRL